MRFLNVSPLTEEMRLCYTAAMKSHGWLLYVLPILFAFNASPMANASTDELEDVIRHLRRAVDPKPGAADLSQLFALRQLNDPTLRPLFYQNFQQPDWQVQVHAVLGLAEIGADGGGSQSSAADGSPVMIDPWLVRQVNPQGHDALIATALDLDLMGVEQIRELLEWDELAALPRVLLLAELVAQDETTPPDAVSNDDNDESGENSLNKLASNPEIRVAGLAAALATQLGDGAALNELRTKVDGLYKRERNAVTRWVFDAVGQYGLDKATPWLIESIDESETEESVRTAALFALLQCSAKDGLPRWKNAYQTTDRHSTRVRLGLMLLASKAESDEATVQMLRREDPLLRAMANVVDAQRTNSGEASALSSLLELGHLKTSEWAMRRVEELSADEQMSIYEQLLNKNLQERSSFAAQTAMAVRAAAELFELDPDQVLSKLRNAEDNSAEQELLLLALFDANNPQAGAAAAQLPRIGIGRADALALTLAAKHAGTDNGVTFSIDDLRRLGVIAAGGSTVSQVLQTQAAWLYLRLTNQTETALTRLFDE